MTYKKIPEQWIESLSKSPESGMGYQNTAVTLKDGRKFEHVVIIQSALIVEVKGYKEIPFNPEDISLIEIIPS